MKELSVREQFPTRHRATKSSVKGKVQTCVDCGATVMDARGLNYTVFFDGVVYLWLERTWNYNPMIKYYYDCTKPRAGVFVTEEVNLGSEGLSAPTAVPIEEAPTQNGKFCDCLFCSKYCQCACHKDQASHS